ncbi:MAG: hypothetical protein WAS54_00715 [Scrofimicrobium sp.]
MVKETTVELSEQAMDASQPFADVTGAPLPTNKTLRSRKSLVPQFGKFVGFSAGIMRMVVKGHLHSK